MNLLLESALFFLLFSIAVFQETRLHKLRREFDEALNAICWNTNRLDVLEEDYIPTFFMGEFSQSETVQQQEEKE